MSTEVKISRLGAQGDGIAITPDGEVFVACALPGESFRKDAFGGFELVKDTASPERIAPACSHFETCGGCALQHIARQTYLDWKRQKVIDALATRGIEAEVAPIIACSPGSRRRVAFSARMTADGPLLGYRRTGSHEIISITECPVADTAITGRLDILRRLVAVVGPTSEAFHVIVTQTTNGLDVSIYNLAKTSDTLRRSLADFAIKHALVRISLDDEVILSPRDVIMRFGDVEIVPPLGGFLQAVDAIEQAMADIVTGHLAKSKRIIDLFSGSGTFTLRLATFAGVHAVEDNLAALAALDRAFRFGKGLRTVSTEQRDLLRRPVTTKELNSYHGLVFDPPRAGAEAQAFQIAKSDVSRVAAVSCNPATLARDLRILIDGGYWLESVTPLDQFLWTPHVEAVALLSKKARKRALLR